jgi:cellobiose phosphorylase
LYEITVKNESGVCTGVKEIRVDGELLAGTVVPVYPDRSSVKVEVLL